ncbi:MAG TPA: CinA family nicotinamide mononucleotide deamidase-related protein, partial [Chitinophagaceae bacterium]|nr:CinA family nicotinamide mononucleotide deamidase-related protein [Chitinophagaceae bacterium]
MNVINASIITIGDELLIGQTIDTNSAFIGVELNKIGIWVKRRIAIGDVKEEILQTLAEQSKDCKLVIITGGLGPTADDITKPALCEFFKSKIIIDEGALNNVKEIFTRLNRPLIERNLKQAEVPHNCTVLHNKRGTAPGMWFEKDEVVYVSLPGVPHEMTGLMEETVLPALKTHFTMPFIIHQTLLTFGQGESMIADLLEPFEKKLPGHIKLAYLPNYGMVKLRLTGKGNNEEALQGELSSLFDELKDMLKEWLVADEDITLQEAVAKLCNKHKLFVGSAESCTGGYLAHLFTARPGSSSSFKGGIVTYANQAKENLLGVQHSTLVTHGAVSEETITEMVNGALEALKVDYVVASSGV